MIGLYLTVHELASEPQRDALLEEFQDAGFFVSEQERAEYFGVIEAEAHAERDARIRNAKLEVIVSLAFAGLVLLGSTGAFAYSYGRAAEAELTIAAYSTAEYATELLRQYIPQGERSLAACIATNDEFRAVLDGGPVWEARVRALLGAAATE